jgi:nitrogen regulatory protein P-II 1
VDRKREAILQRERVPGPGMKSNVPASSVCHAGNAAGPATGNWQRTVRAPSMPEGAVAHGQFNSFRGLRTKIMMTKVEAILQPSRFEAVKEALTELGISGMTISDVRGHGRQKGHTEVYRGREYTVDLLPKIKIEIVIPDNQVDAAVDAIIQSASTGKIGDGKIFLSKIDEAIRIRNQERGVAAL